jgi:hypothetical protein
MKRFISWTLSTLNGMLLMKELKGLFLSALLQLEISAIYVKLVNLFQLLKRVAPSNEDA